MAKKKNGILIINPDELDGATYGTGGLYDRVVNHIEVDLKDLKKEAIAEMLDESRQAVHKFVTAKNDDGSWAHYPKQKTITKYARMLGVE